MLDEALEDGRRAFRDQLVQAVAEAFDVPLDFLSPPPATFQWWLDEAHDIPDDAWERASRAWRDDPFGTGQVVEGECVDVTEQRALDAPP